jgi:hypothetical protein
MGQTVLTPKWVSNGWSGPSEHPIFSADGSRVVVWEQGTNTGFGSDGYYAWAVYNVADGRVLAHFSFDGNNGYLSGATLSPDGKTVYYGTTTGVFAYNIANQTQIELPGSGASSNNGAQYLDITADGATLGYILEDPVSTANIIIIYSLKTQSVVKRIEISNTATSNHTAALKFILGGADVVVSGPTVYSITGTLIYAGTNGANDIAVTPDGTKIFTAGSTDFSTSIYAFSATASSVTALWGPVSSPGFFDGACVTNDGQALLFSQTGTDEWLINGLTTATGAKIPTLTIPRTTVYSDPYIAAIPGTNQILFGPETSNYYGEPSAQVWNYNSSTGTGSLVGTLFEGYVQYGTPTILGVPAVISGQSVPVIAETEYHYSSSKLTFRNASSGTVISPQLPVGAIVSPNGQYYALLANNGFSLYTVEGNTYITSLTITGSSSVAVQWGGNQELAVTGVIGFGESFGPDIYTFDGTNISTSYYSFSFGGNAYKISPDGTIIAQLQNEVFGNQGVSIGLFDVATGSSLGSILEAANSSGIDDFTFTNSNLLGVHDNFGSSYAQTVEYRVYNVSTTTPTLVRTMTYQAPANVVNSGGSVSPDGQVVILSNTSSSTATDPRLQGSIRVYSVSSGALLNQWDNQFVPYLYSKYDAFAFANDSSTVFWAADHAIVAAPIVPFQIALTLSPNAVFGGSGTTGTVTVNPAQPVDIVFALSATSTNVGLPSTVTVPAGSTSATFAVTTQLLSVAQVVPITATYNSATATGNLTVNPYNVASLSLSPATVPGGTSTTGTVTVSPTPGASGATVALSVNGNDAQVPSTVFVPGGTNTATFTVTTNGVANTETLKISAGIGASQQTASLTVTAASFSSLTVSPTSVVGGTLSTGTITLIGNAPSGGIIIGLTSSSSSATVPLSITVAAQSNTATFPINTTGVLAPVTATITGTYVGNTTTTTKQATLAIEVPPVVSVVVSPTTVTGGSQTVVNGTITLGGVAASAGDVVTLTSSNPSIASVPGTITVAGGATTGTFVVTTAMVSTTQTVTITATFNGTSQKTSLMVIPFTVSSVSLNPTTVLGGNSSTGTVNISQAPGSSGVTVALSVSTTDAQVPATVSVPPGATTATFTVTTKAISTTETISVNAAIGASQQSAKLTINGDTLTGLTVAPTSVAGGSSSTGTVTLSQAAPTGGIQVTLASSTGSAKVPASVTVPSGSKSTTFTITTQGVSTVATATISATLGTSTQSAQLTIQPATLASLSVAPTSLVGGSQSTATGTVTITGVSAPNGDTVSISSSNPSVASAPSLVVVNGNAVTATFTITTQSVTTAQSVTFTATFNGVSKTATLSVQPFQVTGLSISPASVTGGVSSVGTVTISQAAGSSGTTVSLSSSSTDAGIPTSVTIPPGASSATFNITTHGVANTETVVITASAGTSSKPANLTILAPLLTGLTLAPSSVVGGAPSTGTVTLSGVAPTGGTTILLSSKNADAVVPASVTVATGSTVATFTISTKGVVTTTTATISAAFAGSTTQTAVLTITAPTLTSLTLTSNSVVGGSNAVITGAVTLSGFGAASGDKITLVSSNPKVATVPSSVTVPAGSASASFQVTHLVVSATNTTTITATFNGISQTVVLTVNPFQLVSLSLSPTTVGGTESSTGTVTLNAMPGTKSGAISVKLASSLKSATVPATVSVALNSLTGSFVVKTANVATATTATITGTYNTASKQATLTIQPMPLLESVSLSPSTVQGSSTTGVVGTLTLSGPAPAGGLVVKLSSSNIAAATVVATVTIPAGSTSATFSVSHFKVTATKKVTLSAVLNGRTVVTTLSVTP